MTDSKPQLLELLDVRGDVLTRGDRGAVAALVSGPGRDHFWIREAEGQALSARAWELQNDRAA